MKLAIMQPYIFPYIGYFQLLSAVDKFVVYDDVNFIKGGWINRNNILVNKQAHLFTVPLEKASYLSHIRETAVNSRIYDSWKMKFLRTLEQSYKKAPYVQEVFPLVSNVLDVQPTNISSLAVSSLKAVCDYMGITTEINDSSIIYNNTHLRAQERVLDICKTETAEQYINPIGGRELYSKEQFRERGVALHFIQTDKIEYEQFRNDFIPNLSIIDVLMFNNREEVRELLKRYQLV